MLNKKIFALVFAAILIFAFAACEVEIRNPEEPSSESENLSPEEMTAEELAEYIGYLSFETISELGYYPQWMQPNTYIIYDENCVPTIIEGGELTPKDLIGRDDIISVGFDHSIKAEPNTKAEYDLHGFIQNIYYLWPDGSYNLAPPEPEETSEQEDSPYLSITYMRDNPDTVSGREIVFYTYDINSKTLKEECIVPCDSSYASGVVSKYDNVVYYSSNTEPGNYSGGNCLWVYDLETGKASILNGENHEYNDILLLDENTLLTMMVTYEHPIMPVLLDLETKEFTYMADANNEPFIYTSGATQPIYNYKTGMFTCIYWNEDEERGDYSSFNASIDHYLTVVSSDLVKNPDKIFTHNARIDEMNMISAVQISENELLVAMENMIHFELQREYYSVIFEENKTTFTKVDCPYPHADYISNLYTIDEGKTFFMYIHGDHFGNHSGIYSYDTETEELVPILLNTPENNGHYVNFSIVGP